MALFSAETIVNSLVQSLGIKPADLQATMQVVGKLHAALVEIEAFKVGAGQMVQHFNSRLDKIEARLARIESNQWETDPVLPSLPVTSNGALTHE